VHLTKAHRIYFWAVGLFALWVGLWGYFVPTEIGRAIPWSVPPLHARFIGAMYLSGAVLMLGSLRARSVSEVRIAVPMAAIWTGMLLLVSVLNRSEFDFARPPVWFWFFAYIVYPVVGAWLAWRHREERWVAHATLLPGWLVSFVALLGMLCCLLSALLFVVPTWMTTLWPWTISPLLAQIYSGPFFAFGIGCMLVARLASWQQARLPIWSTATFAALVLAASYLHRELFAVESTSSRLWFGAFGLTVVVLGVASCMALRRRENVKHVGVRSAARGFCWFVGGFLLLQGVSTLLARLVPAVDLAAPALLAHTQMVPIHSTLHIVTGLIAFCVLLRGGSRGAYHFTLWFSLFYSGLAVIGWWSGSSLGLGLQPFDHPFHLLIGLLGLIAIAIDTQRARRA
jgi:hypothetical protein